jgi:sensor histidine kinase regulating citrate/malate metabolism
MTLSLDEVRHIAHLALLDLTPECVGRRLEALGLEEPVTSVLTHEQPGPDRLVMVGDRVLAFNRMPMQLHEQVIGSVTTMRDRTELSSLEKQLGTTRATTNTLRAQTHEFANQLHTISGLLQLREYADLQRYVDGVREHRTKMYDEVTSRVGDPTVAALLIAKGSLSAERGVTLETHPESRVGRLDDDLSRDLTTVVGNLVDNALDAVSGTGDGYVCVRLDEDQDRVRVTVNDSGAGVPQEDRELVFTQGYSTKAEAADGRGFGLALSRLVCRRRGGDIIVAGTDGATFTATLPRHLVQRDVAPADQQNDEQGVPR